MLVRNERHPREGMPLFLLYLRYFCLFVNEIGDFCVPLRSLPLYKGEIC